MRQLVPLLLLLTMSSAATAQEGRWMLVQTIGQVSVEEPGVTRVAVKPNARLADGATITTGTDGSAILTDGRSSITVKPNSRVNLPEATNDGATTTIRQDLGSAVFKVQKKPTAHFEVQTPYLAAVVKGTTFEVTVDALGASVIVEEGLVDVGAAMSGERTLVPGGQRVRVLRSGRTEREAPSSNDHHDGPVATGPQEISAEITPEESHQGSKERVEASLDQEPGAVGRFDALDNEHAEADETAKPDLVIGNNNGGDQKPNTNIETRDPPRQHSVRLDNDRRQDDADVIDDDTGNTGGGNTGGGNTGGGNNGGGNTGGGNTGGGNNSANLDRDFRARNWSSISKNLKKQYESYGNNGNRPNNDD